MLRLASATPPAWAARVIPSLDEVLLDHAHCEKRAASTAIALVFRYPDRPSLALPLSRLAREELAHFEEVVEAIRRRGGEFRRIRPCGYASRLASAMRTFEPARLVDALLVASLIEARSCERMKCLADGLDAAGGAPELARLYRGLLACEARHHEDYVELARGLGVASEEEIRARLDELARHEAEVLATEPPLPRLHA